jgi:hypothetical protein
LTAPSIPSAGRARATGSEDSMDVRVASFGSEPSRPTSALRVGLGLGFGLPRPPGWAAYTGQTWAHCHPSDAAGRWGTEIRRARTFLVAGDGCRGYPRANGTSWCQCGTGATECARARAGARPLAFRPDSRGLCRLDMASAQALRRARKTAARARRRSIALAEPLARRLQYLEARPSGRLSRLVSISRLGSLLDTEWS